MFAHLMVVTKNLPNQQTSSHTFSHMLVQSKYTYISSITFYGHQFRHGELIELNFFRRRNTSGNNRNTPTMAPQSFVKMEMPVDFDNQQYIVYTD